MGLRGDRLCVGEPGPLSPDDSERFREDRLRLVCSSDACLVIFLNRDVLFLLPGKHTGHYCRVRCTSAPLRSDLNVRLPPVLSLLILGLLVSPRHLGFVANLSSRANFDGCVLKRGGGDGHFGPTLSDDTAVMYEYACTSPLQVTVFLIYLGSQL